MIKLIGIPFDANSSFLRGPSYAPARIRLMAKEGSANTFSEYGREINEGGAYVDGGDIDLSGLAPHDAFTTIRNQTLHHTANGEKLISLGGDHSISYPVIDALLTQHTDLHILHLDAHADLYDNFDGNRYSHASPFARIMETGRVKSLTQVGIRTLNTHQRQQAAKFGVRIIEMKDHTFGFISQLRGPLYISLDLDVLDPAFAPGVSHHEPGGMTTRQLISIVQQIRAPLIGADIVEYNPIRDINHVTAMVAYKLFKELVCRMT